MSLPALLAFFFAIAFGILAIIFSSREHQVRKDLKDRDEIQKRRLYEITILKAIQDRIGYSLDIERVIDTLTSSLKNLFPYSTASSLVINDNKLIFKVYIEDRVSSQFVQQVKKSMLASLATISGTVLPQSIEETHVGVAVDETNQHPLSSFFHIPLVVNGTVVGLVNVSSTKSGLYKDADMTILYQMASQASNALSKLKEVIATEEGKLVGMISSLSDGIFMVDNTNKLTIINETAKKLLGISIPNPTIFDVVGSLSKTADFSTKLQEAMTQNKTLSDSEIQINDKIIQVIITPVVGPSDTSGQSSFTQGSPEPTNQEHVIGASVTLHDVTLERSLNKLKEDFTTSIVHELRSPLTAIKAGSELMLTEKDKLDITQQNRLITIIHEQSERMLGDINSLLDAAKLQSGHFTILQKATDVSDVLQDVSTLFAPEAREKHITISLDIASDIPRAYMDLGRIEQVIGNLIGNSLKFTPEGGSIILHARKYFNDYLPKTNTNPGILISVTDTGVGIPKDKQSTLFSKFTQIQNIGYIHGSEGTGLGLYIAKGIVEAHGGSIFLQSIPQQGTTVSFTLPIAQLKTMPQTPQPMALSN